MTRLSVRGASVAHWLGRRLRRVSVKNVQESVLNETASLLPHVSQPALRPLAQEADHGVADGGVALGLVQGIRVRRGTSLKETNTGQESILGSHCRNLDLYRLQHPRRILGPLSFVHSEGCEARWDDVIGGWTANRDSINSCSYRERSLYQSFGFIVSLLTSVGCCKGQKYTTTSLIN